MADETAHEIADGRSAGSLPVDEAGETERVEVHHKHHPIHSWREFLKEYGIIVLGVLTALCAEQTVEWLHWLHRVHDAEASMTVELGDDDGAQAQARVLAGPCIKAALNSAEAALLADDRGEPAVKLPALQAPPFRTWDNDAWRAAVSSGATSHMATHVMYDWSSPYALVPDMDQAAVREFNDWAPLASSASISPHPTEMKRERLLAAIANARRDNELLVFLSQTFLRYSQNLGIHASKVRVQEETARMLATQPRCGSGSAA